VSAGYGVAAGVVISEEGVALQLGLHGVGLLVSGHYRNDSVPLGDGSEEAQGLGGSSRWLLHHHLLLLCAVLFGLH